MKKDLVLVVDDSPTNLLVAKGHFEAAGFEVQTSPSGPDALAYLDGHRPDLIVLDVLMPGIDGFETCRRIRANPAISKTPILFLTALGDRSATTPALESGADDLLSKPFSRAELLLRAQSLIRHSRVATARAAEFREQIGVLCDVATALDGAAADRLRACAARLQQLID